MVEQNESLLVRSPKEIALFAESSGLYKVSKKPLVTLVSAFTAGIFISLGFICYILVMTRTDGTPAPSAVMFLGGITFSLGLMLVVVCGADLFTSTVLTIIPKMTGQTSWLAMSRNWVLVYVGNFIGALFIVAMIWYAKQPMSLHGQWGLTVLNVSDHKLHHSFIEAICLGFFANLMVCLAVWLSYAGRTLLDKALIMMLPIAMFVSNGFEHSIANMFMIPLGIVIKNAAPIEFWQQIGLTPDHFSSLTVEHFVVNNLIPVTIGNILGGLLVAIIYWWMNLRKSH